MHADSGTRPFSCPRSGGSARSDWCRGSHDGKTASHDTRINAGWIDRATIGFSWDAPQGTGGFGSFPFPYVHTVRIAESTRRVIDEPLLWSSTFAYQYAADRTQLERRPGRNGHVRRRLAVRELRGRGARLQHERRLFRRGERGDQQRRSRAGCLGRLPDRPARSGPRGRVDRHLLHGARSGREQGRASLLPRLRASGAARRRRFRRPAIARRQASPRTQRASSTERNGSSASSSPTTAAKQRSPPAYTEVTNRITDLGTEELKNGDYYDSWKAPRKRQLLSYCVTAEDASGNQSPRSCAGYSRHLATRPSISPLGAGTARSRRRPPAYLRLPAHVRRLGDRSGRPALAPGHDHGHVRD